MIVFVKKGMLTTVQDQGRVGYQRYGMPVCGAMDPFALALANILVGNPRDEAAIEATVLGPVIRFDTPEVFAVTGGDFGPALNGTLIENNRAYIARAGDLLSLPLAKSGARAYVAFAGGLDIEKVMGSRATCLKAGVGGLDGRAVREGDRIGLRAPVDHLPHMNDCAVPSSLLPAYSDHVTVRFTYGPQDDRFSPGGKQAFVAGEYVVGDGSDRMGYRLSGPAVERAPGSDGNIVSDGICFGSIQVPDGQPIVMMADRQTTGGYPKIGCAVAADLPLLGQLKAGDRVRFRPVSVAAAQAVYRRQLRILDLIETQLRNGGPYAQL